MNLTIEKASGGKSCKKRAVIYARVSTDSQENEGRSLNAQISYLKKIISNTENTELVVEPIKDGGETGTDFTRDGIRQLFELASNGEIDQVFVTKLDRLGRCAPETLYFLYLLQNDLNVTVVEGNKHINIADSLDDLLTTTMSLLIGHISMENRVTESLRNQRDQFKQDRDWWVYHKKIPVGYEPSTDRKYNNWIQKCDEDLGKASAMFLSFLENESFTETSRDLTDRFRHEDWSPTPDQVRRLLQRPVYIGRPSVSLDTDRLDETEITVTDSALQIISDNRFYKVQEIISENSTPDISPSETYEPLDFVETVGLGPMLNTFANLTLQCGDCEGTNFRKRGRSECLDFTVHTYQCKSCGTHMKWPKQKKLEELREQGHL